MRDLKTGVIEINSGSGTTVSIDTFYRAGVTTHATPLEDSDAELETGIGYDESKRYDMSAQGVNQKVLVVLAKPSDIDPEALAIGGMTAKQIIESKLADANTFFSQASYCLTSAAFTVTPDWIPLAKTRDFYCWQQEDIDRAQANLDAISLDPAATPQMIEQAKQRRDAAINAQGILQEGNFLFAEALLGAKAVVPNFDTYSDYFVIVAGPFLRGQNFGTSNGFHAEAVNPLLNFGPFDIDFVAPKGIVYVAQGTSGGRIVHELSHFFAIGDIYSEAFADGTVLEGKAEYFEMMGRCDGNPLYTGYCIEKMLNYFDESIPNGNLLPLEWGSVPDFNQTFNVVAHAKTQDPSGNDVKHVIKLKVTNGLYYYVEVRQKPDATLGGDADYIFDPVIPLDPSNPAWRGGVLIYKVLENNNQSNNNERPVNLVPPFRLMQAGENFSDPARKIKISVVQKINDRPLQYQIRVEWGHLPAPDPMSQFDLRIEPWNPPPWESTDIWVNSLKNDDTSLGRILYQNHEPGDETKAIGNGDSPWVGRQNTIFARITNQGLVPTPENVKVTFYVNTPPGVGDDGTWAPFSTADLGIMGAGETRIIEAPDKWRPSVAQHTCIKVLIHPITGEVGFGNNEAQENFIDFETGAASPYHPVEFDFIARNPYTVPVVMDLRARNLPKDWYAAFDHGSVWLGPKENKKVHVVIWTDRVAEWESKDQKLSQRKPLVSIEGWIDRFSDRVFAVGGVTAFVKAVKKVKIKVEKYCQSKRESTFDVSGSLEEDVGVVPLAVHITDTDGVLITERTVTSNSGSFNYKTKYKPTKSGVYKLRVYVLGGSLASEAESEEIQITVP